MHSKLIKAIAKENGVSPEEAKTELQDVIDQTFLNCHDAKTKALQDSIPRKGAVPTVEEFIAFVAMVVEQKMKEDNLRFYQ